MVTMKPTLRILNLEDNANDAELNRAMISARWPHSHFERVDNREAFVAALEGHELDLILCDYTMPGFSGREALALAQEKKPQVPFLFVSGTIGEDTAIEVLKNGATDYVLKHRLMRLIPAVDRALREAEERTERQRAEEAMRQSEHKYRELFECLGEAAFLTDASCGKIVDTNKAAEKLLGCTRGDIIGRKQTQFFASDGAGADGTGPSTFECKITRPDGETVPIAVHPTRLTLYGRQLVLRLCHELPEAASK
jgi:PAS domain S-box-containing protein